MDITKNFLATRIVTQRNSSKGNWELFFMIIKKKKKERKEEKKKDLLGVEVVPSLPGQLSAFAMQITCEEHQKVSGEKKTRRAGRAAKFC